MVSKSTQDHGKAEPARNGSGELTPRQRNFAREYHLSGNGYEAAVKAGFAEKSARQQASRLLTYANVNAELARLEAEAAARYNITLDGLLGMSFNVHDLALEGTSFVFSFRRFRVLF